MTGVALMMGRIRNGWAIYLTNGQELISYRGFGSKQRALRYLKRYTQSTWKPRRSSYGAPQ